MNTNPKFVRLNNEMPHIVRTMLDAYERINPPPGIIRRTIRRALLAALRVI